MRISASKHITYQAAAVYWNAYIRNIIAVGSSLIGVFLLTGVFGPPILVLNNIRETGAPDATNQFWLEGLTAQT